MTLRCSRLYYEYLENPAQYAEVAREAADDPTRDHRAVLQALASTIDSNTVIHDLWQVTHPRISKDDVERMLRTRLAAELAYSNKADVRHTMEDTDERTTGEHQHGTA